MKQKICMITGANSGIGKAAAIKIAQQGHHIIMACRNREKGAAALREVKAASGNDAVELMTVDISLQSSIRELSDAFLAKYEHLDVLIHNAAIFDVTQKKQPTPLKELRVFGPPIIWVQFYLQNYCGMHWQTVLMVA